MERQCSTVPLFPCFLRQAANPMQILDIAVNATLQGERHIGSWPWAFERSPQRGLPSGFPAHRSMSGFERDSSPGPCSFTRLRDASRLWG